MKKKTFIVQLLDSKKPNRKSFTQVEDANFYSNDTDASLVFIPHEDSFDFQTAKVVMYNRSDESLVERDAVVTTENGRKVASYELPEEIILHWGEWVAQPVFINGGEIYSGSIVPFSVIRYLMDNRPPTLRDVIKIDELYSQLVAVMDEISDKDVISAPEIILARGGEDTLGERLDKEHNEVTTQLAQKPNKDEVRLNTYQKPINVSEMDTETKQLFTGGAVAVVGEDAVGKENLKEKAVNTRKTDFFKTGINLFDGNYVASHLGGNYALKPTYRTTNSNARSAVISVEPNTMYNISKDVSNRFRIALSELAPTNGVPMERFLKDQSSSNSDESEQTFTFKTLENENYLVIWVSDIQEEPELYVEVATQPPQYSDESLLAKNILSKNIVKGKNMFNGVWLNGTLPGSVGNGSLNTISTTGDGKYALFNVEPNTTYAIAKTLSNRFIVAFSPISSGGYFTLVYDDNTSDEAIVTSLPDSSVMCVYGAFQSEPPEFMQVEQSDEVTELETYGYKIEPQAKPYKLYTENPSSVSNGYSIKDFGATGDGVTDDTIAIQEALDAYAGKIITIPSGEYKVTGSLFMNSDTTLEGVGSSSHIILGDNFNLSVISWRGFGITTGARPILTTREGTKNIKVKSFKITGNKTQHLDRLMFGFAFAGCNGGVAEDIEIDHINYFPNNMEGGQVNVRSFNLAVIRSNNIRIRGGKFTYGGYECIGTELSEDVILDGVYSGIGWRTSVQLHRGSKNIKIINATIIQNTTDANSALTFHGTETMPVEDIKVDNMYMDSQVGSATYRGGIQSVDSFENNITIKNSTINTSAEGINSSSNSALGVKDWIIKDNHITSGSNGIRLKADNSIVKDNIIDSGNTALIFRGLNNSSGENVYKNNNQEIVE